MCFTGVRRTGYRVRLKLKPKFYFFDTGIAKALSGLLSISSLPGTSYYGDLFEQFIIQEAIKLNDYYNRDFQFNCLATQNNVEIDLIITKPDKKVIALKIKSTKEIKEENLKHLLNLGANIENATLICVSNDLIERVINGVICLHWQEFFKRYFCPKSS